MTARDLPRDCLVELKQNYMMELVDEGTFGEIVYGDASITHPAWGDMIDADEIVPDDVIFEYYDGIDFVKDDFFCMLETSYEEWEEMENVGH